MKFVPILFCALWLITGSLCMRQDKPSQKQNKQDSHTGDEYTVRRRNMVTTQIAGRGIKDKAILEAMLTVPRHLFIPDYERHLAYEDYPLPIGHDQTISQPYIVAYMTEILGIQPDDRVLEVGTGSGYQAAVLSVLAREVYSIEIVKPLCEEAADRLKQLGYLNVHVRCGDGYAGWPEKAPFDAIMITAAPEEIPQPLIDQLAPKGRLIVPLGSYYQELVLVRKDEQGKLMRRNLIPVRFVPMTGEAEK
ncbi:protein-L-isoaspartate(D-aspartate) O-methyltransferase [candidate division KSB1 bacterium]|nr:protein-L-isoaspartate(D-aspartate) O-methyltransferase [candidate division KSB1 bacterium]